MRQSGALRDRLLRRAGSDNCKPKKFDDTFNGSPAGFLEQIQAIKRLTNQLNRGNIKGWNT